MIEIRRLNVPIPDVFTRSWMKPGDYAQLPIEPCRNCDGMRPVGPFDGGYMCLACGFTRDFTEGKCDVDR